MSAATLRQFRTRLLLSRYLVLYLSLAYFALAAALRPEIASGRNLHGILLHMLPLLVLVIGQMFVLITGGIDLSMTAVVSAASVLGATLMTAGLTAGEGTSVALALAAMVLMGAAVGFAHGAAIALLHLPPFLVTLTSMMFIGQSAVWYTRAETISRLPASFVELGYGAWHSVPYALAVAAALALGAHVVLSHTVLGRRLYGVGHNAEAARISGVPVAGTICWAYAATGACAAVASMLYMARLETGKAALVHDELLLDCIGAAVIGGTSLFGGRGTVLGCVLGALFITLVGNSLMLLGMAHWHVEMSKGSVILLAAIIDAYRNRLAGAI